MERTWIDQRAVELCRYAGLETRAGWLRLMAGTEPVIGPVRVVRRILPMPGGGEVEVYCKHYIYGAPSWRFWGRASKARREYENYALFDSLHIPCARRMACLENRDGFGRLRDAFLITEAVPDTMTLLEFARLPLAGQSRSAAWRARMDVCRQLAKMTRALHRASVFHNDLYWRNVLVQGGREERPRVWWIDCPRGGRARLPGWREQKQIKDLAALDKDSQGRCHDKERLRFFKCYLGQEKLSLKARGLLAHILAYRKRRWPERR